MPRNTPIPTDAELAILRVLWDRGPCTVRQVYDVLNEQRPTGYTTVLKFMQIMMDKGLVGRDERERTHVYHALAAERKTQRQLLGDLLDRAFGGSASSLVMQALEMKKVTPDELRQIGQVLQDMQKEHRP